MAPPEWGQVFTFHFFSTAWRKKGNKFSAAVEDRAIAITTALLIAAAVQTGHSLSRVQERNTSMPAVDVIDRRVRRAPHRRERRQAVGSSISFLLFSAGGRKKVKNKDLTPTFTPASA
ncbi:MAG TPA: hypothetical protein VGS96_15090 [Thermoanaerobaculia bacterium]|jgi:hypothetical protein|nr:hypothetical protein [Thermoanaerobaculia bacterium]